MAPAAARRPPSQRRAEQAGNGSSSSSRSSRSNSRSAQRPPAGARRRGPLLLLLPTAVVALFATIVLSMPAGARAEGGGLLRRRGERELAPTVAAAEAEAAVAGAAAAGGGQEMVCDAVRFCGGGDHFMGVVSEPREPRPSRLAFRLTTQPEFPPQLTRQMVLDDSLGELEEVPECSVPYARFYDRSVRPSVFVFVFFACVCTCRYVNRLWNCSFFFPAAVARLYAYVILSLALPSHKCIGLRTPQKIIKYASFRIREPRFNSEPLRVRNRKLNNFCKGPCGARLNDKVHDRISRSTRFDRPTGAVPFLRRFES